jgi:hypothetical protein
MDDLAIPPQGEKSSPSYLNVQHQESAFLLWWYRLASPPRPAQNASFSVKERFRRGRASSQLIPAFYILLLISLSSAFGGTNPFQILIVGGGLLTLTMATLLNRLGMVGTAGFIVVATAIVYPTLTILTTPGGLNMLILPLFGLLVLPLVCAVSFLPEWWVFVVALVNIFFTFYALMYAPQTAELNTVLQIDFAGIITPIILIQIIVSVVAYLWVHSTVQALNRADRAEELARLEHDLALQSEAVAQQKQQVDDSIQQIVKTLMRWNNGDTTVRIPLTQENVLWQVAGAINNLLGRVQRSRQDLRMLQSMTQALRSFYEARNRSNGGLILDWTRTNTPIDALVLQHNAHVRKRESLNSFDGDQPSSLPR